MARARRRRRRAGEDPKVLGTWKVLRWLAEGGNGDVYQVERDGRRGAAKVLRIKNRERLQRFRDEVHVLVTTRPLPERVLPILEYDLSDEGEHWFVMPLAREMSMRSWRRLSTNRVVAEVAGLALPLAHK